MILYKYKPLTNLEYILDIIVNERLYCAKFEALNDPFEGIYMAPSTLTLYEAMNGKDRYMEAIRVSSERRVCSLSANPRDVRLWAHYADGHRGVAIEIEIPDADVSEVRYIPELIQTDTVLLTLAYPEEVLKCKTNHWDHEHEYRIIQDADYYPIKGRIRSVLLGERFPEDSKIILDRILTNGVPMIETRINPTTLEIERGEEFIRQN